MLGFRPNIGPEMWTNFLELPYVNIFVARKKEPKTHVKIWS
jgi:hypothetical protein